MSRSDCILGLDVGTSSIKAVVFGHDGSILARAKASCPLHHPQPGHVEQDPEALWQALVDCIGRISSQIRGCRVAGMAMAAQSGSVLAVDDSGRPLTPFITWADRRAQATVAEWEAQGMAHTIRAITGWRPQVGLGLATIAWLRAHSPNIFARTRRFLAVNDFLLHRLTGQYVTNPSNAGGLQLLDLARGDWSPTLCAWLGIGPDQLSPIRPGGEPVGPLRPEVRALLGLGEETLVYNGGHDQACTAWALGVTDMGRFLLGCGTAWVLTGTGTPAETADLPPTFDVGCHLVPGRRTFSTSLGGVGDTWTWWVRLLQGSGFLDGEEDLSPPGLETAMDRAGIGARGVVYLAVGIASGLQDGGGALLNCRVGHGPGEIARAIWEGAAFELRLAVDALREQHIPVNELRMVGGGTRSRVLATILTNVLQRSIRVCRGDHWAALGAAYLAGLPPVDLDQAFGAYLSTVTPDPHAEARYAALLSRYRVLREAYLRSVYPCLAPFPPRSTLRGRR